MVFAVELDHALEHHGARREVDAERQRLGGEHDRDEAFGECDLDGLFQRRNEAGVMAGDAAFEGPLPVVELEAEPGVVVHLHGAILQDLPETAPTGRVGEVQAGSHTLVDRLIAARSREE